jgi:hypothetical protein
MSTVARRIEMIVKRKGRHSQGAYIIDIHNRGCDIISATALLSIPRWLAVRVQVLSGEDWNEVLLGLQTCRPGQGKIKTTIVSNVSPQ